MNECRFCVYVYRDKDNVVFYVGSGNNKRPYQKTGRNQQVTNKLYEGYSIEILHTALTKQAATDIEDDYLKTFFSVGISGWNLLNKKKSADNVKQLTYSFCAKYWYHCPTSPSGLRWKQDRVGHNGRTVVKAGEVAGSINSSGYFNTTLSGKSFGVHRIVWVLVNKTNLSTDLVVNHIDSSRTNNLPSNLEAITPRLNNIKKKSDNIEMRNIRWHKRDKVWEVRWVVASKLMSARFNPKDYQSVESALIAAKVFRNDMRDKFYL